MEKVAPWSETSARINNGANRRPCASARVGKSLRWERACWLEAEIILEIDHAGFLAHCDGGKTYQKAYPTRGCVIISMVTLLSAKTFIFLKQNSFEKTNSQCRGMLDSADTQKMLLLWLLPHLTTLSSAQETCQAGRREPTMTYSRDIHREAAFLCFRRKKSLMFVPVSERGRD